MQSGTPCSKNWKPAVGGLSNWFRVKPGNSLHIRGLRSGSLSRQPVDARARAWKFIFDCHEKKKAGAAQNTGHDAMKGSDNDDRASTESTS